jgi:hypothetical protein
VCPKDIRHNKETVDSLVDGPLFTEFKEKK